MRLADLLVGFAARKYSCQRPFSFCEFVVTALGFPAPQSPREVFRGHDVLQIVEVRVLGALAGEVDGALALYGQFEAPVFDGAEDGYGHAGKFPALHVLVEIVGDIEVLDIFFFNGRMGGLLVTSPGHPT